MPMTYRLQAAPRAVADPVSLDETQRRVVDHAGGPLLVLAGPGTGKTTTLVEAVVDRIERRGLAPDQVLVLTFSRKAADELRDRITARIERTTQSPISSTFHSFCYGLIRQAQPADLYEHPLRLLSAPEQDVKLRELLTHSRESGRAEWPTGLEEALRTRGFAREVHAVLARAREKGLEPDDLQRIGKESGRQEWVAAGAFMAEYLEVMGFENAIDYSELIHRAVMWAESTEGRAALRSRFKAVFVDEYQDTDPAQVRLLKAIAGDGRDLVVVGDPDQSIYAFRGAEIRGILDFPRQFPQTDGSHADIVALGVTRRFGRHLLTASRRIAAGIALRGSIDSGAFAKFRNPEAAANPFGDGKVEVVLCSSVGAETDHIADILRRAHLEDGVGWSDMAVLVRSGVSSIPGLRRALVGAGVPVEVAGDEVPLRSEPAVAPLLGALRVALDADALTPDAARTLLMSPLGGLDASDVRRLGRDLRAADRDSHLGARLARSSGELICEALREPALLPGDTAYSRRARRLSALLHQARSQLAAGAAAEEALWTLWQGTSWPRRLRAAVDAGGAAARVAHRDLDAICALFELAARAEEKQDHVGARVFLDEVEAQQIPADSLADKGVRGDAVRLLTAHRSKGLEWRVVVVAGVQDGTWPDLRRRGSLLEADRLGPDGLVDVLPTSALLAEERRLFYVAVTRARQRLVVTAVKSPEPDGEQPSRLIDDLLVRPAVRPRRPARPLSPAGLIGELRRIAGDDGQSKPLRRAAAARLARLCDEPALGPAFSARADPERWWGMRPLTDAPAPVRAPDAPLAMSASGLSAILDCPLKWFLAREAAGESGRSIAMGFGSVIHVLAEHFSAEQRLDADAMIAHLDDVWDQLQFESEWVARRERAAAEEALRRFANWHNGRPHRRLAGVEVGFETEIALEGGERVTVKGKVDRVELDEHGQAVVVDFKTSKTKPSANAVTDNPQLGLYQLVVESGALAEACGADVRAGGAELVMLRHDDSGLPKVLHQAEQVPDETGRKLVEVQLVNAADVVRREDFVATENDYCSRCTFNRMCPAQQRGGTVLS